MFGGNSPSLADIAAVTDNRNNDGMMGMNGMGGWWVLIILLALFGGFGNGGWGNDRRNSSDGGTTIVTVPTGGPGGYGGWGAYDAAAMQRGFDNSGVITKLDGIANGMCSLGYDQLAQMNGLGNTVMRTGWGLSQQMQQDAIANMQAFNAAQQQRSDCCCKIENQINSLENQMDRNACQTNWNLAQMGRDIMDNDNANFRSLEAAVRDGFAGLREQGYIQEIQGLRQQLNDCNAANLAQATARQVVQEIRPCPVPSYDVPNPYCNCGYSDGGCCRR